MLLNEEGRGSAYLAPGETGETGRGRNIKIMVLEPRRVAAKAAARRMAAMLGERVGQRVGYRVKLDTRVSSETRIEVWYFGNCKLLLCFPILYPYPLLFSFIPLIPCILQVVTDGILIRMLQSDPELAGVGAVLFDEFHERNLDR